MHKCASFLLVVIACSYLVFSVEGRLIKSVSKNDSKQSSKTDSSAMHQEDHQPGDPGYIPNAAHNSVSSGKKKILPHAIPTKSSDIGDSVTGYKDDFRPTAPGNSPGAGHTSSPMHKKDRQPEAAHNSVSVGKKQVLPPAIPTKSSDFSDSVTGYKDDFRPTTPGNSPGAGHSFAEEDEDIEQKPGSISSSNEKHSIAGEKEDLRATTPGHSPGVGHAFVSKNSEPKA
ncbi:hypothetical protein DITRI_Ditri18aG0093500 [Diplodiscus trichospermus]